MLFAFCPNCSASEAPHPTLVLLAAMAAAATTTNVRSATTINKERQRKAMERKKKRKKKKAKKKGAYQVPTNLMKVCGIGLPVLHTDCVPPFVHFRWRAKHFPPHA